MKTGIIIANTGSPADCDPDSIEAYLREFLLDDRICQMPKPIWRHIVYKHILPKRKFSSAERYKWVWMPEGSPLLVNQQRLVDKLQASYSVDVGCSGCASDEIVVRSAMSYGEPSIANVLRDLQKVGCERIVLLPLYPQSAYSITQAVVDAYKRAQKSVGWAPATCVIDNYHDNALYVRAVADSVRERGFDASRGDKLVLSFHAIPLKDEKNGDTYRAQTRETADLVAAELGIPASDITVSYQSVFGHKEGQWASPLSVKLLPQWRNADFRVFFCCPGFAVDCLETLFDVPNEICPALEGPEAKPLATCAETAGDIQAACNTQGRFNWVPCLNATERQVAVIRSVLDAALAKGDFATA